MSISLLPELRDPPALVGAVGRSQEPIALALPENHQILLAKPQQRVDFGAARVLPHVDFGMRHSILDYPPHPANALAAAQIGQTVILDATFLHQVPKRSPSAPGFRLPTAAHLHPAKLDPTACNLADENAVESGFVSGPVAANPRANAFTSAGSARVVTGATPSVIGVTTVFRPGRWRIASGTRTVMLVAAVMPPPPGRWARWR